ncbi:type I-C CRISPR-associated protein Cas7/Csd2 [Sharpea azabuensis]|uniref:type I-C CRISPR-associated protein Cas7/Csd2 n=1 Tax=Sharpea azabuensis TaxID=322505 RepID=UPI001568EA1F|nr:type I-C CRISPR-associated protein Cas7/Csd2 [Sharpea azabuensis]
MEAFGNKVDFAVIVTVNKANPNGDPLNGNRPREDFNGFGEISDVCIKRKIRNRLQDMGERIFVQSSDRSDDGAKCLSERATKNEDLVKFAKNKDEASYRKLACQTWIDVRSFGQVFAFKSKETMTTGIRGPVTVQTGISVDPINITTTQITKSVNSEPKEGKSSDTMGSKNRVDFGVYIIRGSINHQLAELTGFSEEDAEKIKHALISLFDNDASSARPDGSMEVVKVYWWKHNCYNGQYSTAKVQRTLQVHKKEGVETPQSINDYEIVLTNLEGLSPEVYEGR